MVIDRELRYRAEQAPRREGHRGSILLRGNGAGRDQSIPAPKPCLGAGTLSPMQAAPFTAQVSDRTFECSVARLASAPRLASPACVIPSSSSDSPDPAVLNTNFSFILNKTHSLTPNSFPKAITCFVCGLIGNQYCCNTMKLTLIYLILTGS